MMILKKLEKRTSEIVGDVETTTIIQKLVKCPINDTDIDSLETYFGIECSDDWEEAYSNGFVYDLDGCLISITINNLLPVLKEKVDDWKEEGEEYEYLEELYDKLKDYELYTLWMDGVENDNKL